MHRAVSWVSLLALAGSCGGPTQIPGDTAPVCSEAGLRSFDPGVPVLSREVERRLRQATLGHRKRLVVTACEAGESESDCQSRGKEEARAQHPDGRVASARVENDRHFVGHYRVGKKRVEKVFPGPEAFERELERQRRRGRAVEVIRAGDEEVEGQRSAIVEVALGANHRELVEAWHLALEVSRSDDSARSVLAARCEQAGLTVSRIESSGSRMRVEISCANPSP